MLFMGAPPQQVLRRITQTYSGGACRASTNGCPRRQRGQTRNIDQGVFLAAVALPVRRKDDDGRPAAERVEKLNGARLTRPSGSTLVTHAMGRGVTIPTSVR